jgi:hypothetical protein
VENLVGSGWDGQMITVAAEGGKKTKRERFARSLQSHILVEVLCIAARLELTHLCDVCASELQRRVDMEWVLPLAAVAYDLRLPHLLRSCYQWLEVNVLDAGVLKQVYIPQKQQQQQQQQQQLFPLGYRYGLNAIDPWEIFKSVWEQIKV